MGLFGKKNVKFSGWMGDLSEEQEDRLQEFKDIIQDENLTEDPRYDDHYLLRFLRARKFNIKKTLEMFKKFLEWRVENRADDAIWIDSCPSINKVKEFYEFAYHGVDREGRPFSIDKPCSFDIDEILEVSNRDELYAFYVKEYETTLHIRMPAASAAAGKKIEQTFNLISIKGFTMKKLRQKTRNFIKLAVNIGQDNYPEIMGKMLIVDSPLIFRGAWALISPFIDEKTRTKISILGGKYQKKLFEHVDPENVPSDLGGECTCSEDGGCYFSHKGPWNEYPADQFGEAAKEKLLEQKDKEEVKISSFHQRSQCDSEVGAGVPPLENNKEVSVNMINFDMEDNNPKEKTDDDHPSEQSMAPIKNKNKKKRASIFCCGKKKYESDDD
ncbi:unnamed protein product [Moneuplotes crassus]|uniref:CRAL-TRIO domain-containing protein n=1 Tax=Euplotes crassus TaxID=5936 RepID=A0AAD1XBM8_EUPCR|nr:unnamed protein product [Moneuplotes crassus]